MYLHAYGGSALLHLLAAHPKVVGAFGIAAVVAMLISPQGPGRYVGTAAHLARLETALAEPGGATESQATAAARAAARMVEEGRQDQIRAAVAHTLRRCGSGCTDLSTARVAGDPVLLRRVLVLYELDRLATARSATTGAAGGSR